MCPSKYLIGDPQGTIQKRLWGLPVVDANQLGDYIKAIDKLAIAMTGDTAALNRQHEVKTTNALEELADKMDAMRDDKNQRR